MSLAACEMRWPRTTRSPWLANSLAPRYGSSTEGCASLACSTSGSFPSRPTSRKIQARVPTLPTPTTLRAMSTKRCVRNRYSRSASRLSAYWSSTVCTNADCSRASTGPTSSRIGTSSGGTWLKRSSPSTRSVSFLTARRLVLRRALANGRANSIRPLPLSLPPKRSTISLAVRRSYQTSRWLRPAKARIASRYSRTQSSTIHRRRSAGSPTSRPAISALAAIRLTSHSHGPGQGLVEVVGAEDDAAIGGREAAEVGDVRVAAGLHDRCPSPVSPRDPPPSRRPRRGRR